MSIDTLDRPEPILKGNGSRSPERQEQALVDYCLERYSVSDQFDRPFKNEAWRHWQQFKSVLPEKWPYYSRWFEPETQNACYDIVEGMMAATFAREHPFDVLANDDQDEVQTELMRACMDYVLREKINYKVGTYDLVQECVIYGNGVMKDYLEPELEVYRGNRMKYADNGFGSFAAGVEESRKYSISVWPRSRIVSRFNCYPAPTGNNIQNMPYFIERVIVPVKTAQKLGQMYGWKNTDKLQGFMSLDQMEHQARGTFDEMFWDLRERLRAVGYDVIDSSDVGGNNVVKYTELLIYNEAPVVGRGCARMAVIGDRQWCLKAYPENPFFHNLKSYHEIKFAPQDPDLWQAAGVPKLTEDIQMKVNALSNGAGDIIERARGGGQKIYGPAAGVRQKSDLDPYPVGAIEVDGDPANIKDLQYPDVPQGLWQYLNDAKESLKKTGGSLDMADMTPGAGGDGPQAGVGKLKMMLGAASAAKSFRWRLAEETGISEGLNIVAQLIQQGVTSEQKIRIIGENKVLKNAGFQKFAIVTPEDIAGRWQFHAVGASNAYDGQTMAQLLTQWAMGVREMPDVSKRLKQIDLATEIAELSGVHNPQRFLMSDEELQSKMQSEPPPIPQKVKESLKYEKAAPEIQRQIEAADGFKPSTFGGSSPGEKIVAEHLNKHVAASIPRRGPPQK